MAQHAKDHGRMSDAFEMNQTVRELVNGQLNTIEITTPSSAGLELRIAHGLGRIPNGYIIVKRPYTGTAMDHGIGSTSWDTVNLYLKFSVTDIALTLAVY